MNKVFLYFCIFDDFSKWRMPKTVRNYTLKNHQIWQKMKKSLVQLASNLFFGCFLVPENPISGNRSVTSLHTIFFVFGFPWFRLAVFFTWCSCNKIIQILRYHLKFLFKKNFIPEASWGSSLVLSSFSSSSVLGIVCELNLPIPGR